MWKIDDNEFMNPQNKYRMKLMHHSWDNDRLQEFMDALLYCGFGGVVTNPSWAHGGSSEKLIEDFSRAIDKIDENNLKFWIYDEKGYPSGHAGGETLKGHKDMEAKGFYMVKRVSYPSNGTKKGVFRIDEETDKIIWAAKYPLIIDAVHDNYIDHKNMEKVQFTPTECEYTLEEGEILVVFCVKPAYEGSHCTHNVSSFLRYINVMDEKAVKRFIDILYEPTVMDNVTMDDAVMGEEIFGPVMPILTYEKFEDLFGILSGGQKPLALYIFSQNKKHIDSVLDRISFGGGCVNDVIIHLATSEMGFGGVGESGMGAYHGKAGFDAFSHTKSIVDKKHLWTFL